MLLAITIFELSSGQIYIRKYPIRISGRISGLSPKSIGIYFDTVIKTPENFMLLAITVFELSSGQTYIRKYPIRISDRISGRMIGLSSNFHQYFKSTIFIHLASFRQIGWIWGNFIRPDIRPDLRIVTKIGRTLPMDNDMKSWKSHSASDYRSCVILRTDRQTNATENITSPISSAAVITS